MWRDLEISEQHKNAMIVRKLKSEHVSLWLLAEVFWLDRGLIASRIEKKSMRRKIVEEVLFSRFVDLEQEAVLIKGEKLRLSLGVQVSGQKDFMFSSTSKSPCFHDYLLGAVDAYFQKAPDPLVLAIKDAFSHERKEVQDVWRVELKFASSLAVGCDCHTAWISDVKNLLSELQIRLSYAIHPADNGHWRRLSVSKRLKDLDPRLESLVELRLVHEYDWNVIRRRRLTARQIKPEVTSSIERLADFICEQIRSTT